MVSRAVKRNVSSCLKAGRRLEDAAPAPRIGPEHPKKADPSVPTGIRTEQGRSRPSPAVLACIPHRASAEAADLLVSSGLSEEPQP